MKIVFTGGGSAGHVLPALPVMRALRGQGAEIAYIGGAEGADESYLAGEDLAYFGIASGKLRRYFSWRNFADVFAVLRAVWQSYWLLRRLRPDAIFSKGGFVSFPVVLPAGCGAFPWSLMSRISPPAWPTVWPWPFLHTLLHQFPK